MCPLELVGSSGSNPAWQHELLRLMTVARLSVGWNSALWQSLELPRKAKLVTAPGSVPWMKESRVKRCASGLSHFLCLSVSVVMDEGRTVMV